MSRIALVTWSDPSYVDPEPRAVAALLREQGHVADVVVWHDASVQWQTYDLVVIRSTWDYFHRLEEFLAWVDHVAAVSHLVNPAQVVRWNCHKGYLAQLGSAGIPVVPTLMLARGTAQPGEALQASGWDEVVVKPAVDGGARLALKAPATSSAAVDHVRRLVARDDVLVQPYVASVEQGETSLFYFGGRLSHAVRKVPKPGDYRVQALHGGSELVHEATADEQAVAEAAMALAPGQLTYARADFLQLDGRATLMELELIEPDLFLRTAEGALERYADALLAVLHAR